MNAFYIVGPSIAPIFEYSNASAEKKTLLAVCDLAREALKLAPTEKQLELLIFLDEITRNEPNLENRVNVIQDRFYMEIGMANSLVIMALMNCSSKEILRATLLLFLKSNLISSDFVRSEPLVYYALTLNPSIEILQVFKEVGCQFHLQHLEYETNFDHLYSALLVNASYEILEFLVDAGALKNTQSMSNNLKLVRNRSDAKDVMNLFNGAKVPLEKQKV